MMAPTFAFWIWAQFTVVSGPPHSTPLWITAMNQQLGDLFNSPTVPLCFSILFFAADVERAWRGPQVVAETPFQGERGFDPIDGP